MDVSRPKALDAYADHQREREDDVLEPGIAFPLVRKLLALNAVAPEFAPGVEVILLSAQFLGQRPAIFIPSSTTAWISARHLTSAARCGPTSSHSARNCSCPQTPNRAACVEAGVAAATILPARSQIEDATQSGEGQLRIAFDGDAVIFSDESERVSREHGVEAFGRHERERAHEPLSGGPFRGFLSALHDLQVAFPAGDSAPIRTALVTARSAPAHERVIRTLREWGVRLDEALFLGGREKGPFLEAFGADIFFDDSPHNIDSARRPLPPASEHAWPRLIGRACGIRRRTRRPLQLGTPPHGRRVHRRRGGERGRCSQFAHLERFGRPLRRRIASTVWLVPRIQCCGPAATRRAERSTIASTAAPPRPNTATRATDRRFRRAAARAALLPGAPACHRRPEIHDASSARSPGFSRLRMP